MTTGLWLTFGVISGTIGLGDYTYGRKQQKITPLISGIGLMGYLCFVDSWIVALVAGITLILMPFFVKV